MAYSRVNILRRILRVQEIYLANKDKGYTNKFIYEQFIADQFNISIASFYKYLAINARRELKELQETRV